MRQRFKYISSILITSLLAWSGCTNFLDKEPVNILTETSILSDQAALTTQMAYLYNMMPFDEKNFKLRAGWLSDYSGEMVNNRLRALISEQYDFNSWKSSYVLIRALNNMIEKVPSSTAFVNEKAKTEALGELRFMRAYVYFTLVQRYGGVPLVKEVSQLPASGDISELYQARDKAVDVYNFIETEMNASIDMMSKIASEYRFNKWSGLAFKSQAMLYAASIAKYHEIQLNGLIGIPAAQAQHFFESARDAAKLLIETGPYALYNVTADKVSNYHKLFFDKSAANKERIFVEGFLYPTKTHEFDLDAAPYNHRGAQGSGGHYNPTFDMVESYEYTNNANGTLKIANADGSRIEYANPADLFKNKDPRFFACVLFPGSQWMGSTLEIYGNVITGGIETGGTGVDGLTQTEATSTGFYMVKWADPAPPVAINSTSSDVDKMFIRYAEVLLNYAEAQLELGNEPEARKYINMIRDRAGLQALAGPVTTADYRHERKIELAYEGNYYWDLIRWRIFHIIMYNTDTYALWPVYNKDKKVYIFRKEKLPINQFTRTFDSKLYYNKLQAGVIASNPLLVENPDW